MTLITLATLITLIRLVTLITLNTLITFITLMISSIPREDDYTERRSRSLMLKMSVASRRGAHFNKTGLFHEALCTLSGFGKA